MLKWRRLPGPLGAWSSGTGPRIIFVHGFTQTAESWKPIAADIATTGHECVVVDAPGHGESADVRGDMRQSARTLVSQCGTGVYVGYSMGARLCLHAAVDHHESVRGLASIGGTPGIADPDERDTRRRADDVLAAHIEEVGVGAFIDEWLRQPLFNTLTVDHDDRLDRSRNTAAGLASSLRSSGAGAQDSLWDRLAEVTLPVLVVAGERDTKFVDIARRMASVLPEARFITVPEAGHAAHLEQPGVVTTMLRDWLDTLPPPN